MKTKSQAEVVENKRRKKKKRADESGKSAKPKAGRRAEEQSAHELLEAENVRLREALKLKERELRLMQASARASGQTPPGSEGNVARQAEEALRESEALYRILTEVSRDMISLVSAEGKILYVNIFAARQFGLTPPDLIGKTISEYFPPQIAARELENIRKALNAAEPLYVEAPVRFGENSVWLGAWISPIIGEGGAADRALIVSRDITERKQAEEEARLSRRRLIDLINSVMDAVISINSGQTITLFNPAAEKMFGYKAEEVLGQPHAILLPERYRSAHALHVDRFARTGITSRAMTGSAEITGLRKNGEEFPLDASISQVEVEGQKYLTVILRDITGRKQAEENLRRQNLRLKTLREIDSAILAADSVESIVGAALGHIRELIECQRASLALIDWETKEGLIFDVRQTGKIALPKGSRVPMALFQDINETLSREQPVLIDDLTALPNPPPLFQAAVKEGARSVCVLPLISQGGLIGTFNMSSEIPGFFDEEKVNLGREVANQVAIAITQNHLIQGIRASEERYRTLFTGMLDGVYRSTHDGKFVDVNPAMVRMFGYDSPEEMLALDIKKDMYFAPEERVSLFLDTGQEKVDEFRMKRRDGSEIWVEDHGRYIHDGQGNVLYHEGILRDITERKQAEKALRDSESRYRLLFDNAPLGILLVESDGTILEVNPTALSILGSSSAEATRAINMLSFPPLIEAGIAADFEKCARQGALVDGEYQYTTKWGKSIHALARFMPIMGEDDSTSLVQVVLDDATERKQAEENLRVAETRYRTLVEQLPLVVYINPANDATYTVYVSPQIESFLGYTREEWLADPQFWSKALHPDDRSWVMAKVRRMTRNGEDYSADYRMIARDGSVIWVRDQAVLLRDSKNEPQLWQGFMLDITERKQAEEALREAEAKYRNLVERLPVTVYTSELGANGRWFYVSPQIESLLGFTPEEWLADPGLWFRQIHPEDRDRQQALEEQAWARGEPFDAEYRIFTKDGSTIWIRDTALIIPPQNDGAPIVQGTLIDVTERKRTEEALRQSEAFTKSIVENEPECVKIVGPGGILQYMNPAGLAMIEADDLDSVIGKSIYPIVAAEDRQAFIELTERVLRGEQGNLQFQITGLKGARRWMDTRAVPLYDDLGNVSALLSLTRDVTERKQAEDAARASEEKYRSIFENAIEGIYQSAPGGRFQTVNPAFAHMLGYDSPQDMIASITDIASQVYRDPSQRADFIRQLEEQGSLSGFEYQMRRRDGAFIWVSENTRLARDADGNVLYYEGIVEDITSRKRSEERIQTQLNQLNALHIVESAVTSNADLRATLDVILREVSAQLQADAACVLLFNKISHTLDFTAGRGFNSKAVQHTKLGAGQGYAGRAILERRTVHIPDLSKTDNTQLLDSLIRIGENFAAYVGSPLIAKGQVVGILEIFQRSPLTPDPDWFDFLALIADQAALAIENAQLFENLQRSNFELTLAYDATIEGWSRALDLRDRETEGHTRRVTDLTVRLARQMGVPDADILHIRRGALLHDIGKMGIPDSILHKPDALTPAEWDVMRQHTNHARQMLTPIAYLRQALDIPLHHHEKWDGSGYPEGLKGEQIPLAARIFAVVDVWDALTSDRSYRAAWSKEDALAYIRAESGRHFDPGVVENFLPLISDN